MQVLNLEFIIIALELQDFLLIDQYLILHKLFFSIAVFHLFGCCSCIIEPLVVFVKFYPQFVFIFVGTLLNLFEASKMACKEFFLMLV